MASFSWAKILEAAPRLLMGLLPGITGGGASVVKNVAGKSLAKAGIGGVFDYPRMTDYFNYDVDNVKDANSTTIGGHRTVLPAMNGTTMARGDINAALAQSLQEHNRAVQAGTEKQLEEWWPGEDVHPRKTLHPKSTAIDGIRITKGGNIQVRWRSGRGKWYTYRGGDDIRQTTERVKDLLLYPSIGRALAHGKGRDNAVYVWPNSAHINPNTGKVDPSIGKTGDPNLSGWRDKYYAEDWASLT